MILLSWKMLLVILKNNRSDVRKLTWNHIKITIQLFVFLPWTGCCWSCRCRSLVWGRLQSSCEGRRTASVSEKRDEEKEAEPEPTGTEREEVRRPDGSNTQTVRLFSTKDSEPQFYSTTSHSEFCTRLSLVAYRSAKLLTFRTKTLL